MTSPSDSPSPDELLRLVSEHPLLNEINPQSLNQLKDQLSWVLLDPNEDLFKEGEVVDAFYFLIHGEVEVATQQEDQDGDPTNDRLVVAELGAGATIGEMAILSGGLRNATVTAVAPTGLVRFPKETFDRFLSSDERVVSELTKRIMPRLYRNQIVRVLPKLFGELDEGMLHDLQEKMTWVHLPRGETLCREGEPSTSFYIIISGRVQVLVCDGSGKQRQVGELSQSDSVGEMGVFTDDPRSATIVASRDTELVEYSRAEFDEFIAKYPQLMLHLMKSLINRLQGANRREPSTTLSNNILLAPASDHAPLDEFAERLHGSLADIGGTDESGQLPCLLLTSRIVDDMIGYENASQAKEGQPGDLRLRSWLSQQERVFRVILFQTDLELTAWTKRCISSADEIMFVANASARVKASSILPEIKEQDDRYQTRRRRSLVLLHDPGVKRPTNTRAWFDELNLTGNTSSNQIVARHFHVRRGNIADSQRVARFVLGKEVGLVLSGGGARGFAHVGCIRAMKELGIPIDVIGGVSMGSLVSAAYAYDPESFEEKLSTIKSQLKGALLDFTAPMISFARGRRFDRRLQAWFEQVMIEDLWLPYFCVSSNLTEAGIVVFELGELWRAVRASGTLPGLTSPVVKDNCLLFDGCLLDNLPMDVMRDRVGDSQVVAVDVVPPHDLQVGKTQLESPSGWWLLWNRINPFAASVEMPNLVSILHRAAELGSVYGRQRLIDQQLADLYLQPPVDEIDIADFSMVGKAADIGYEHCKNDIANWWAESQGASAFSPPVGGDLGE